MTLEEATKLVDELAMTLIPAKYRWRQATGTLRVQGGWVRLGDGGIRAAVVETVPYWLPNGEPINVHIRVLVGNDWYFLDTEEKETNE